MSENIPVSQAESVEQPATPERRRAVRFESKRRNSWRLFATATCCAGQGTVHDVSVNGLSLTVDSVLRPGMFLDLTLVGDDPESTPAPMLVRVRRVTPQGDGTWVVGCTFVKRLSKKELTGWL